MTFAVLSNENMVENLINAEMDSVAGLSNGLGLRIECCEGFCVQIGDKYNLLDGKFYRDGIEVAKIPTVQEQIQIAIDAYTFELIQGGLI